MSYILDALRKSEQQRLQGEAPLLVSTQLSSNVGKQPALLLYGLVAAILICAGIFIGWLRPWQQDETATVKSSTTLTQNETKPPQIAPMPQFIAPETEKAKKPELVLPEQKSISTTKLASKADRMEQDVPVPSNISANTSASISAKVAALPRKSQTSTAVPQAPEQIVDEAATPAMEKTTPPSLESNSTNGNVDEVAQEQKVIAMTELPLAIQQEIPKMSISGHAYSTVPKERIVGINDRLLQEGEYLAPGLRLEQITADGLVFSYKKYLFRHSL